MIPFTEMISLFSGLCLSGFIALVFVRTMVKAKDWTDPGLTFLCGFFILAVSVGVGLLGGEVGPDPFAAVLCGIGLWWQVSSTRREFSNRLYY